MPISLKYFMECEYKSLGKEISFKEWFEGLSVYEISMYIEQYIDSSGMDWYTFISKN